MWNEEGATLDFVIPPAWYQTSWFVSLCAAAFLVILWMLHYVRLHRQAQQFDRTLEVRVGERTRIARDLHDTLLQSLHGLLLRFQSVSQLLPERPLDAKHRLDSSIEEAAEAITEARDAVQGLRSSTVTTNELAFTLKTLGEELAINEANPTSPRFGVEVFGAARELHPIVRDEVYRVASEALRNAFLHAHAQQIEVEIRYEDRGLLLRIHDDGKGIDPQVLVGEGRTRHYGLRGMRERAGLVGGKLEVWSELNAGTEIELTIPSANAYTKLRRRGWRLLRFSRKGKEDEMKIES
jgi:signal transduction histidine kinase